MRRLRFGISRSSRSRHTGARSEEARRGPPGYLVAWLLYMIGWYVMNGMLALEFVRKTQLEADQIAAQQIQQTLHPQKLKELPGYTMETYYKAFRNIGGDYFDVVDLPNNRMLFAVADVSGKGMPGRERRACVGCQN